MRKICFLLLFLFLPFFVSFSFASREEIINKTLARLELAGGSENTPSDKYSQENLKLDEASSAVEGSSETEEKGLRSSRGKFYISAGHDANHMHYKELTGKDAQERRDVIDEDYGKLRGFYVKGGYKSNYYIAWMRGSPFIEAYFRRYAALITYDGGSSLGPLSFDDEHAKVQRFGIKLGAYRDFLTKAEIFGYFDIGKRIWYRGQNRIIQGVIDYPEKYWWTYFGLGAGVNYDLVPRLSTGIEVELMGSPEELTWMRADFDEGGTFDLGCVFGAEVKLPVKYYFLKNLSFDVTPYFTYWKIDKSTDTLISGRPYYEPDSKTHIEGLLVGLTYGF